MNFPWANHRTQCAILRNVTSPQGSQRRAAKSPCRQKWQIHRFLLWAQPSSGSQHHLVAEDEGLEDHDMTSGS